MPEREWDPDDHPRGANGRFVSAELDALRRDIADQIAGQVSALQRELRLELSAHLREHSLHSHAHDREHEMTAIAVSKAEQAMDRRLEGMNELRAQLNDQAATFVPRIAFEAYVKESAIRVETALVASNEKYDTVLKSVINRHDVDFENLREALQTEREIRKTFEGSVNTFRYLIGLFGIGGIASILYLFVR